MLMRKKLRKFMIDVGYSVGVINAALQGLSLFFPTYQ